MHIDLKGKRALITGGSRGIGAAISESLGEAGASVVILGRNTESLLAQQRKLEKIGVEVEAYECDVLRSDEVDSVWNAIDSKLGGVDILINNVGGGGRWGSDNILETPAFTWDEVLRKNLGVATQLTSLALPNMQKKMWGRVITITSIYGVGVGGRPWFNIAKVAQTTFTKNLAKNQEFSRRGITFNSIAPGAVYIEGTGWSEMKENNPEEFQKIISSLPLGRMGKPEEVAALALFICSDYSSFLNGASITIDGGETSSLI